MEIDLDGKVSIGAAGRRGGGLDEELATWVIYPIEDEKD